MKIRKITIALFAKRILDERELWIFTLEPYMKTRKITTALFAKRALGIKVI